MSKAKQKNLDARTRFLVQFSLTNVTLQMMKDFGGEQSYWVPIIQSTNIYHQILDTDTKMYLEGTIYLCDCLITELKEKGVLQ